MRSVAAFISRSEAFAGRLDIFTHCPEDCPSDPDTFMHFTEDCTNGLEVPLNLSDTFMSDP
jgi:hypothetical protein